VEPGSFTVLVVCTGNVNRSALGAVLLREWAGWYLPALLAAEVEVTSAGLRAPVGNRMGRRARAIAAALGADGSDHRAQQLTEEAVRAADLVLVSSTSQRDDVLGMVPGAVRSTFTIREAGRIAGELPAMTAPASVDEMRARVGAFAEHRTIAQSGGDDDDIVDPQGKDDDEYRLMARQEVPPLAALAGVLLGMPPAEVAAYTTAGEAADFDVANDAPDAASAPRARPRGRREA